MGEFKDSSLWLKLAFVFSAMAMILWLMPAPGMVTWNEVEACYIIGFFGLIVGLILIICIIFVDECQGNKPALICYVIFTLVGGIMTIVAVGVWGGKKHCVNSWCVTVDPNPYASTSALTAGVLGVIAAIFAILELVGFKSGAK